MARNAPLYEVSSDDSSDIDNFVKSFSQNSQKPIESSSQEKISPFKRLPDHSISDSDDDLMVIQEKSHSPSTSNNDKPFSLPTFKSGNSSQNTQVFELDKHEETRKKKSPRKQNPEIALKKKQKDEQKKFDKLLKDVQKEIQQSKKPEHCFRSMKIAFDNSFNNFEGNEVLFNFLLDNEISYVLENNFTTFSLLWYKRVEEVEIVDTEVLREKKDVLEKKMLIYIPTPVFLDLVHSSMMAKKGKPTNQQTLLQYVNTTKNSSSHMDITFVTIGIDRFLIENSKDKHQTKNVKKSNVDDAVGEMQFSTLSNFYGVSNVTEFAQLISRITKALAEAPLKLEKQQMQENFSWYAQADTNSGVKLAEDGSNVIQLWQQQLQQFNLVGEDIAQAIVKKFPKPTLLYKAYQKCSCEKEAVGLLQDIVVRRDYGPLGTNRRVGPELSYKIYKFLTSTTGNEMLER